MSMVAIVIFTAVDAKLFMKWKPGLILSTFISSVNYVKDRIISLSFLFFIDVVMMALQLYIYMT